MAEVQDDRKGKVNPRNENFQKAQVGELWNRINREAAYTVHLAVFRLLSQSQSGG